METTKFLRNTSAGGILLLLGTIVPAYAQHDEKGKGADPQEKGGQQRAPRAEQPQRPQREQQAPPQRVQQAPPQRAQQPPQQQQQQPQQRQQGRPQRAD